MHTTSKSLRRTVGGLALGLSVVAAAFGLTGCGSHGGGGKAPAPQPASAPIGIGHTIQ